MQRSTRKDVTRASHLEKYTWIHLTLGMLHYNDPKATAQLRNERINQKGYKNKSANCVLWKMFFGFLLRSIAATRSEAHDLQHQIQCSKKCIVKKIRRISLTALAFCHLFACIENWYSSTSVQIHWVILLMSSIHRLMKRLPAWAQQVWKWAGTWYHSQSSHWLSFQNQLDTGLFPSRAAPQVAPRIYFSHCQLLIWILLTLFCTPDSLHSQVFIGLQFGPVAHVSFILFGFFHNLHVYATALFHHLNSFSPPPQASSSGWTVHLSVAPGSWVLGCRGARGPAAWTWPSSCTPSKAVNTPFGS